MKEKNIALISRVGKSIGLSVLCLVVFAVLATTASAKNKKYGIFVGINDYPGIKNDLDGAVGDAKGLQSLLVSKYGFLPANTSLLRDKNATRENIIARIKAYGQLAGDGDIFVFHYSGHGSLFPDVYSDELDETQKVEVYVELADGERYQIPLDYYDSALVPWDSALTTSGKSWRNMILDDELYGLFADITRKGATVVFIADSCHSGTISKAQAVEAKIRFISPEQALNIGSIADLKLHSPNNQVKVETRSLNGSYIALSAAQDNQFAMDASGGTAKNGLFTAILIQVIKSARAPMTYTRLMELVRSKVAQVSSKSFNCDQHPQLDTRFGNGNTSLFVPIVRSR